MLTRIGIVFGYLAFSTAIFVFGSSYYTLFRTNRSLTYRMMLPAFAGIVLWLATWRGEDPAVRWLAVGVLAASAGNLMGWAVARLKRPLRIREASIRGIALAKALESVTVIGTIVLVLVACRVPMSSVYLTVGRWRLGLGLGLGGLLLFATMAAIQARRSGVSTARWARLLPWAVSFGLANAVMEELWFRGVFLRSLSSLLSPAVGVLLTAAVFATAHIGATYLSKNDRLRFLAILFPLGAMWAVCTHFTGSLLASSLIHAGADLIIVNSLLAQQTTTENPTSASRRAGRRADHETDGSAERLS